MKKLLVATLILASTHGYGSTRLTGRHSLDAVTIHCETRYFDLPFWAHMRITGSAVAGALAGFFIGRGLTNIVQPQHRTLDIFDMNSYSLFEKGTTGFGLLGAATLCVQNEKPESRAKKADQDLLSFVLDQLAIHQTDEQFIATIEDRFINSHYPLATAVLKIKTLKLSLLAIEDLLNVISAYQDSILHNMLKKWLHADAQSMQRAMRILECDSRYAQQNAAMMLDRVQYTQDRQMANDTAGLFIHAAHAYHRN